MITSAWNQPRCRNTGLVVLAALIAALTVSLALAVASASAAGLGHGFTGSFGSKTSTPENPYPLSSPSGVAINEVSSGDVGDVYVVDKGNNRVEYFNSTGTFQHQFNGTEIDEAPAGAGKEAPAKFSEPEGIAIDNDASSPSAGDVYVLDKSQGAVDKFSAAGGYLFQLKGFASPVIGVTVDQSGHVWVAEEGGGVKEFSNAAENALLTSVAPEFARSPGIAVDSEEHIYLVRGSGGVAKFSTTGATIQEEVTDCECTKSVAIDPSTNELYVDQETSIARYGPFAEPYRTPTERFGGQGHPAEGAGIAVNGATGTVYVADSSGDDVDVFGLGALPPAPTTEAATEVTHESATLNGALTSGSEKVKYFFRYKLGNSCTGGENTSPGEAESNAAELASISGLEPSAEYTFCLDAENAFGVAQGSSETFTTLGVPASAETEGASEVAESAQTGVVVHGSVNPHNQETSYAVEYSTSPSLEHATTVDGAATIPAHLDVEQEVSVSTGPLAAPGTTFYYRIVAENGTAPQAQGAIHPFTTFPSAPNTEAATEVTAESATLNGTLTSGSEKVKDYFVYALGDSCAGGETPVGEAESDSKESFSVSHLQPSAEYTFCLDAENTSGTTQGSSQTFITPGLPAIAETEGVSEVAESAQTGVILHGKVNPLNEESSYAFEYSTSPSLEHATTVDGAATIPAHIYGNQEVSVSTGPLDAPPGTVFYYRVVAENGTPPQVRGAIHSFPTVPPPPSVTTESASETTSTSARLAGTVTPGTTGPNSDALWSFQYGTDTSYSDGSVPATPGNAGMGTSPVAVATELAGLAPNTTYHYRLVATNTNEYPGVSPQVADGADETLTTLPAEPIAGQATGLSETGATLNGHLNPSGHPLEYRFEYGISASYGQSIPTASAGEANEDAAASAPLTGLTPGVTYHYRLVAIGAGGASYSHDATFTLDQATPAGPAAEPFPAGTSMPAPFATPALLSAPVFTPPPAESTRPATKTVTRAERLAKALKSCRKDKSKAKRQKCEKAAKAKYGPKGKKTSKREGRS